VPESWASGDMRLPACKRSEIIFQDHNVPLSWENVELRGFEPLTSCMPYRPRDIAGRSLASLHVPFTSSDCGWMWPGVAGYRATLAPNLAPSKLLSIANVQ
jgi:hypothetical protein